MFNQSNMPMPSGSSNQRVTPERLHVEKEEPTSAANRTQWQQAQVTDQMETSPSSQAPRPVQPMQKRRRVTRACDECRRKKIKCDGKQPCTHCTVYSYECTFDQPSNRRRNPAPQYIEALENRLQRAEALLKQVFPNIDLTDPNFEMVAVPQRREPMGGMGHEVQMQSESVRSEGSRPGTSDHGADEDDSDAQLRSMIETTGQLEIDDRGHWDFHGGSSGAVFLKRMREQFTGLLGEDPKAPFLPRLNSSNTRPQAFAVIESPRTSGDSPMETGLPNVVDLPSKQEALQLVDKALNCACALLRFVHHPSYYKMFHRIYDTPAESFGDEENKFLPLLYVTLALGCMFVDDKGKQGDSEVSYREGIEKGLKYFKAARGMMDITDCRDMQSLQAILFMILFLQSSANLSTCYSYIGIALRSALRMGLHRNLAFANFNFIELETRRRVFWIIRKMDTYVAALLGFPKMLSDQDVDQELPSEVDDEYISETKMGKMPPGKLSVFTASNAHTRLMAILAKVIREIYPTKAVQQTVPGSATPTYVISHAKIKDIEIDLQNWLDKLPMGLKPGGEPSEDIVRVQQLLRMAYAHVQMMLYRPFLHYVSSKHIEGKPVDDRSYACAAACVSVSRNIVHITAEMQRRGLLIGAYWFTMYTTFFAILSLAFFVLENPTKPGTEEILANASAGRDALKALARTSLAADRCSQSLTGLFEQLRIKVAESRSQNAPDRTNKRRSMGQQLHVQLNTQNSIPVTNSPIYSSPAMPGLTQRAMTFPAHPNKGTPRNNIEKGRHTPTSMSDPNLRQTFQNLMTSGMASTGSSTPDTNTTSGSPALSNSRGAAGSGQDFYPPFSDAGLTDLSAMMFPSADPFVYPNQPMLSYDSRHPNGNSNVKAEFLGTNANANPAFLNNSTSSTSNPRNMFLGNIGPNTYKPVTPQSTTSRQGGIQSQGQNPNQHNLGYDNLEGQVFGPLPPYLMDQQGLGMGMDLSGVTGLDPLGGGSHTGFTPGLTAGQGWEDMFGEWTTPGDLQSGGEMKGF